ncbi:MAG: methyl-accepting chemotaxis protein [Pseudomonadota bacterium]
MSLSSLCRRLSDRLERMVANAKAVNAASRARADLAGRLVTDATAAHGRLTGLSERNGQLRDYLTGASERIGHLTDIAMPLTDRIEEMRDHVSVLLEEETHLQDVLTDVTGHSRAVADIARLARLLSINAAVEAARAGEAGRGFAVVAREMQALSDQTTQRAADIDGLVLMLAERLAQMRDRVGQTRAPLDHLADTVGDVLSTLGASKSRAIEASETAGYSHALVADEVTGLRDLLDRLSRLQMETEAAIAGSAENVQIGMEALRIAGSLGEAAASRDDDRAA